MRRMAMIWSVVLMLCLQGFLQGASAQDSADLTFGQLREQAFTATQEGDFATAEQRWSELLELAPDMPALWSNRGNARVSQNKLEAALSDYDRAIQLAPQSADLYLNRGTALEGLGRWQAAIDDYNYVLELNPEDAAAYNNRGNAEAGAGDWTLALADYGQAVALAADYAFARANYSLTLYQLDRQSEALQEMRKLVRKYPKFPDMRAALSAGLWSQGRRGEAESHWAAAIGLDSRYQDLDWVRDVRRWPPAMVSALDAFLSLK